MAFLIQISFHDIRAVTSYVFECSTSSLLLQTPSSLPDKAVGSSTDEDDCVEEKTEWIKNCNQNKKMLLIFFCNSPDTLDKVSDLGFNEVAPCWQTCDASKDALTPIRESFFVSNFILKLNRSKLEDLARDNLQLLQSSVKYYQMELSKLAIDLEISGFWTRI